jgi:hypothetical protein
VAADSTGGDKLQSSAVGTGYPVVIANTVQSKEVEKKPMTTWSGVMIRQSARSEVTRRIYDRGKDYLSSSIIENTNRSSSIGREQVSEVQVIQVNDSSDKNVANQMHKFMREVIGRVEPEENKKLPLVEAKYLEGHVGGEMMYHALFRDGYY